MEGVTDALLLATLSIVSVKDHEVFASKEGYMELLLSIASEAGS